MAYRTLSLEAYAVIQANRREGIRELDVLRFRQIRDKVDWEKVLRLGERTDKRKVGGVRQARQLLGLNLLSAPSVQRSTCPIKL